jgi:hypothetical protein
VEREGVLEVLHAEEYVDLAPTAVFARLFGLTPVS